MAPAPAAADDRRRRHGDSITVTVTVRVSATQPAAAPTRIRLGVGSRRAATAARVPPGVKYYCVRVHPGGRRTRTVLTPSLSNSDAAAVAAAAGIHRADH